MSRWDADVAVVGLGAWGAMALWQLASRGVEVIGFERHHPGHALGSSYGGSRMFRVTCLEHPGLVPLARRSQDLWRQLEDESGRRLFFPTGGLLIGPEEGVIVGGTLRAARAHGIEVHTLTPVELRERFPRHTGVPGHHRAVWEPSAGVIRSEESIAPRPPLPPGRAPGCSPAAACGPCGPSPGAWNCGPPSASTGSVEW